MKRDLLDSIKLASIFLLVMALSCSGGSDDMGSSNDNEQLVIIPSNLILTIDVLGADANFPNGDGSGVIQCTAMATDAVKYGFNLNHGDEIESHFWKFRVYVYK
jgi:hypothetical protein